MQSALGWDENGKQIRQSLGYYTTRDEATIALANYNTNPYDISGGKATFKDVYEKWSEQKFATISKSNIKGYSASYRRCTFLYDKKFKDIGIDDLQYVIDTCGCNFPTLKKIKILFNQMFKYAVPRKLTDRDYSESVDIEKFRNKNPNKKNKNAFSKSEINKIEKYHNTDVGKIVLMLIYCGMRIGEFLNLKKKNCHLDSKYIEVTKSKTDNGIRKVPISDKTLDYWHYFYNKEFESPYLITMDNRDFADDK